MNPNPYLKQYQQTQIQTASQEQILLMLYDGAIQFLNKAKKGIEDKNIEVIHNNIIGAQKIISEFMNTLDMETGGDVAKNLYGLYDYMYFRLVQANVKRDSTIIDEVLVHLKELRRTWDQAIKITNKEKVSEGRSIQINERVV